MLCARHAPTARDHLQTDWLSGVPGRQEARPGKAAVRGAGVIGSACDSCAAAASDNLNGEAK
jgi:hypothetical protein